jgi:hypothetical protein
MLFTVAVKMQKQSYIDGFCIFTAKYTCIAYTRLQIAPYPSLASPSSDNTNQHPSTPIRALIFVSNHPGAPRCRCRRDHSYVHSCSKNAQRSPLIIAPFPAESLDTVSHPLPPRVGLLTRYYRHHVAPMCNRRGQVR